MRAKSLGLAAALAVATVGAAFAADWKGDPRQAAQLIATTYAKHGVAAPQVSDTGRTFDAGGATWRVFQVTWQKGGFRHVAVHRQANGEYLALEGSEKERKWSRGVPIGR